ncbi:uncharacterized protein LOC118493511 [Sander lucioperca]|uniref:uncharacterized protein LOC118493511 n=1 Tax=Sander lucioperca TaxID=283035 RepID=UPI001653ACBA|nr:uncharacterized protein LOC118493511 [Sander lucioperca]XP_035849446.1 uncharacterized protein LOC118493511 [Sander lucioperca]
MAVNSSNDSIHHPDIPIGTRCFMTRPSSFIFFAYSITNILLLLPVCILVLYLGLQRWRRHRSTSATATTSHSDSFTYHMVTMELLGVFGYTLCCCGIYGDHVNLFFVGFFLWSFNWYGEIFFHILTCVERYLAVVHPVTYLSLRGERGIRIRNISIGCVWLLSSGATGLSFDTVLLVMDFSLLIVSLFIISFCSLSVLCVLIRPGPGEQGGDRERVDQSKQRAFYTIMAILVVLLLTCSGNLVELYLCVLSEDIECVLAMSLFWFNLPSSLVLPLLFLHRAGILACRKNNT